MIYLDKDKPINPSEYFPEKPLLGLFQCLIFALWWVSLNEHIKALFIGWSRDKEFGRSIGIDFYELLKWSILGFLFWCSYTWSFAHYIVAYLISSNLFGHFYYHVWRHKTSVQSEQERMRRRFFSFLLAFMFMLFGYAFLYLHTYSVQICWPDDKATHATALFLSISNTFTLTYGDYGPATNPARFVFISQVLYAFLFLVVIVANSLPGKD